ncbi:hypothetical protein FXO38_12058 [Capsicum annuum]|nr:hypothetical protein FXO37_20777 [Capsicum annuum]KAF3660738.1 hypothetical protein FXO38_12058 [Capsicum annuum]
MDKVWINYYGMPVCFALKEFAIVTGLRCDHPEEPLIKETPHKGSNKCKGKKDRLGHVNPFLPSESSSRFTQMRFLIQGSLGGWLQLAVNILRRLVSLTLRMMQSGASSGGVAGGVIDDGGSHPNSAVAASLPSHLYTDPSHPYGGPSHPSSPLCSHCKCKVCKDREDKLLEKLEVITKASEDLKSKKGVIPSKKLRKPYTPTVAVGRKTRNIRQILSIVKTKKISTLPALRGAEVQGPQNKVDIYAALGYENKKELQEIMNDKTKVLEEYTMYSFVAKDFTNIPHYVDKILYLMRGRQLAYPDTYDVANRIIDPNFYNNFKDRYDELCRRSVPGSHRFDKLVSTFEWYEDMIKYVKEKRPYPHGKSWTKTKKSL